MKEKLNESLGINIAGTKETIDDQYAKLAYDLQIFQKRPFLGKQEKYDFAVYRNHCSRNHIVGLLNYDTDGNFLPDVFQAPLNILNMLYPISDLIGFEKQGILIIDREQYSPELSKLSFFIYMVDSELYKEYKTKQNFLGDSAPTYMYDRKSNNGIRVFKDYDELARHLARQRYISFCIGPRAIFYLRHYLHAIHEHVVENEYAFGRREHNDYVKSVVSSIRNILAFKQQVTLKTKWKSKI